MDLSKPWILTLALLLAGTCQAQVKSPAKYLAVDSDFVALQEGMSAAQTVQENLFPHGVQNIDAVMYDARNIFVFSRNGAYKLDQRGQIKDFHIYVLHHEAKLEERDMAECGRTPEFVEAALDHKIPQNYFSCAPWRTFERMQKERGTIYDNRNSYLAAVVHEFAHAYMDQELWQMPVLLDMMAKVRSLKTLQSKRRILEETFASWCELRASRDLYPEHFKRLSEDYFRPGVDEPRNWAIKTALELLPPRDPNAARVEGLVSPQR